MSSIIMTFITCVHTPVTEISCICTIFRSPSAEAGKCLLLNMGISFRENDVKTGIKKGFPFARWRSPELSRGCSNKYCHDTEAARRGFLFSKEQ
jgi:hypothetical protein